MEKLLYHIHRGRVILAVICLGPVGWGAGFLIGWGAADIMRRLF